MKIDLSDLIAKQAKIIKMVEDKQVEVAAKITLDVHAAVVLGTPVDTGEAQGGWTVETPTKPFQNGKIENNVAHIVQLEAGHSSQAPNGIVNNAVEAATRL